jgi:4-amino-4-deoxy-L-arabinose transferase-like glycosyltransferase
MRTASAPPHTEEVARATGSERRGRVPGPLVALLAATAVLALAWVLLVPAFQAPDENAHFAYVQSLAERFALPGDPARPVFSQEQVRGADALNADQVAGQAAVKPEWSPEIAAGSVARDPALTRDSGGGPTPAAANPPAAYLWEALGYQLGGGLFGHVDGARLASAVWLLVTVLAVWLLAGEIFGRRPLMQLAAASVPALMPMVVFVSTSVSVDGMLYAMWSLALWLGVRVLRKGPSLASLAGLAGAVGLACVVKTTSFALLPPLVFVLLVLAVRERRAGKGRLARIAAAAAIPLALTIGAWYAIAHGLDRRAAGQFVDATHASTNLPEFASYLWQFYLPKLPFMTDFRFTTQGLPLYQVWLKQGWGAFGWLEIRFGEPAYRTLAIVTGLIGLAAIARLLRGLRSIDWVVFAFLAGTTLCLFAGLHWTDYHQTKAGSVGFMQARYLFPVVGIAGIALAGALDMLPQRIRGAGVGVAIGGLLVVQVVSLGLVLERFYA